MTLKEALALIRDIPDFPKPGIIFKDISPVLENAKAFEILIDVLAESISEFKPEKLAGIESRGFIFASALAYRMKTGLVLIRKKGKLPSKTWKQSYQLEYGTDEIEMHRDAVQAGERVVIVDDVLATGGTLGAAGALVQQANGNLCGAQVVIEIPFLKGRERLSVPVKTVL